ncbi:response regulator [Klebsiella pneumoniae]|nr:response regulator [Klebsiella pneumoniae]
MNNNNLIIVAEDDDDIAAILTGYLRKAGMKTLRAEDGEAGNQSYPFEQA